MAKRRFLSGVSDSSLIPSGHFVITAPVSPAPVALAARVDVVTDGTLPDIGGGGVAFLNSGGTTLGTFNWRRVKNTNTLVIEDFPPNLSATASLRITVLRPSDATYFRVTDLAVSEGGVPQVIAGGMTASHVTDIAKAEAETVVAAAISSLGDIDSYSRNGLDALRRADTERVDIVMLSNSHGQFGGGGLARWMQARLAEKYGSYATGLNRAVAVGATSGMSADLASSAVAIGPLSYVADGANVAGPAGAVFFTPADQLQVGTINPKHSLRVHFDYATFPSAGAAGQFRVRVRREDSVFNIIGSSDWISTIDAAAGETMRHGFFDIPADASRAGTNFAARLVGHGDTLVGPFFSTMLRVEDRDALHGISHHVRYAAGGQSAYDIAAAILAADRNREINFLAELRRLQVERGQRVNVTFHINEGHNQRNETLQPSLGRRAITDADSPLGFLDDVEAIQTYYAELWTEQGWDLRELTWIVFVDHPDASPDGLELPAHRRMFADRASRMAGTSFFNWLDVLTYQQMVDNGSFADGLHLVNTIGSGYDFLAQRFVATL